MYKYFKPNELKCKCGRCGSTGAEMSIEFMRKIDALRERLGFPFAITSAYRCPKHNNNVSLTGLYGPHTTGHAIDIAVSHGKAYALIKAAIEAGFTGIGVNQKGAARFIHLDDLEASDTAIRATVWSY